MTGEQLAAMHRLLAEYHRRLAKEAVLDVVQQYHSDLAQRLSDEAALIPAHGDRGAPSRTRTIKKGRRQVNRIGRRTMEQRGACLLEI
jgi:phage tail tape-measure protein